jgi:hypothetical protein
VAGSVEFSHERQAVRGVASDDAQHAILVFGVGGHPEVVGVDQSVELVRRTATPVELTDRHDRGAGFHGSSRLASHSSIAGNPPGSFSTQLMSAVIRME